MSHRKFFYDNDTYDTKWPKSLIQKNMEKLFFYKWNSKYTILYIYYSRNWLAINRRIYVWVAGLLKLSPNPIRYIREIVFFSPHFDAFTRHTCQGHLLFGGGNKLHVVFNFYANGCQKRASANTAITPSIYRLILYIL